MALDENDLELLEGYLDDALGEGQVEVVRTRLAGGQEWIAALERLRCERAMRQAVFAALEPSAGEVERLVGQVHRRIERRRRLSGVMRVSRWVAGAAACFVAGIIVHSVFLEDGGADPADLKPVSNAGASVRAVETYEVTLRDESGKVVAVQRFDSLDKAQEFANDISQWQRRAKRLAGGQFVVRAQQL